MPNRTNNLVLMGPCGQCPQERCRPGYVDIIITNTPTTFDEVEYPTTQIQRVRLFAEDYEVVWASPLPAAEYVGYAVALGHSFDGGIVALYADAADDPITDWYFHEIEMADGVDNGALYGPVVDSNSPPRPARPSQEAAGNVAFLQSLASCGDSNASGSGRTITPAAAYTEWAASGITLDNYGGSAQVGDYFYLYNVEEQTIERDGVAWLDTSPYEASSGSPAHSSIIYDHIREVLFLIGFKPTSGDFAIHSITLDDTPVVTEVATDPDIVSVDTFTRLDDGLYWIERSYDEGAPETLYGKVWRYSFETEEIELLLETDDPDNWPDFDGGVGCSFFVGEAGADDPDCECPGAEDVLEVTNWSCYTFDGDTPVHADPDEEGNCEPGSINVFQVLNGTFGTPIPDDPIVAKYQFSVLDFSLCETAFIEYQRVTAGTGCPSLSDCDDCEEIDPDSPHPCAEAGDESCFQTLGKDSTIVVSILQDAAGTIKECWRYRTWDNQCGCVSPWTYFSIVAGVLSAGNACED